MLSRILTRLSYANVVATLALFLALGGGAYAAMNVTGADVRDDSLTGRDVRKNSITRKDVRGLTSADFKRGEVLAGEDNRSVVQANATVGSDGVGSVVAQCPDSMVTAGGGFETSNATGTVRLSAPAGINAWVVYVEGASPGSQVSAFAVCVV